MKAYKRLSLVLLLVSLCILLSSVCFATSATAETAPSAETVEQLPIVDEVPPMGEMPQEPPLEVPAEPVLEITNYTSQLSEITDKLINIELLLSILIYAVIPLATSVLFIWLGLKWFSKTFFC